MFMYPMRLQCRGRLNAQMLALMLSTNALPCLCCWLERWYQAASSLAAIPSFLTVSAVSLLCSYCGSFCAALLLPRSLQSLHLLALSLYLLVQSLLGTCL